MSTDSGHGPSLDNPIRSNSTQQLPCRNKIAAGDCTNARKARECSQILAPVMNLYALFSSSQKRRKKKKAGALAGLFL